MKFIEIITKNTLEQATSKTKVKKAPNRLTINSKIQMNDSKTKLNDRFFYLYPFEVHLE